MSDYFEEEIEFQVKCVCGNLLEIHRADKERGLNTAHVFPCDECLKKERSDAEDYGK